MVYTMMGRSIQNVLQRSQCVDALKEGMEVSYLKHGELKSRLTLLYLSAVTKMKAVSCFHNKDR